MAHADAIAPRGGRDGTVQLTHPDRDTLALSGTLTFATVTRAFADAGRALADGAQTRLDLGGLVRADSAGLACVLALAAAATRVGRRLRVVSWPAGLRSLAEVCDVVPLLDGGAVLREPLVGSPSPRAAE